MRTKAIASLILLCGASAAFAEISHRHNVSVREQAAESALNNRITADPAAVDEAALVRHHIAAD